MLIEAQRAAYKMGLPRHRVQGLGGLLRVQGLESVALGLGFGVWGSGFRAWSPWLLAPGSCPEFQDEFCVLLLALYIVCLFWASGLWLQDLNLESLVQVLVVSVRGV